MGQHFRHAAIVGKYQALGIRELIEELAGYLKQQNVAVSIERQTAENTGLSGTYDTVAIEQLGQRCDLAVVVGGDGTMLGIAREMARQNIPVVGINQGRLGFITDIPLDEYREALGPVLRGDYEEERRSMLEGAVWHDGQCIFQSLSLNDVAVSRGATAGMVELRIDVGDEFIANIRADGLVVATPTGSTAYSLSAGGPILHPSIWGWVVVPIASHTLSNRPIVLPDAGELCIRVVAGRDATANFDMQSVTSLVHGDEVRVHRSEHAARFLHPAGWSYYATLRRKLGWYGGEQG